MFGTLLADLGGLFMIVREENLKKYSTSVKSLAYEANGVVFPSTKMRSSKR